ncbi:MAG: T9SS type A sorting domain-containing protein [Crocinitomicaceae bacterium]
MKYCLIFFLLLSFSAESQSLVYSPSQKLEKVVDWSYYDADIMYLTNKSSKSLSLRFELIENTLESEWSAAFCTNIQCYNNIPSQGDLGTLSPDEQAYFQFNFGANSVSGEGHVKILVTSEIDLSIHDTLTFKYTVTESGGIAAGPWAKVNYYSGALTVLLENPTIETSVKVFNVNGSELLNEELGAITSFNLRKHPAGVYFVRVSDANGRVLKEKIIHI